jgi:hypothetical protein
MCATSTGALELTFPDTTSNDIIGGQDLKLKKKKAPRAKWPKK